MFTLYNTKKKSLILIAEFITRQINYSGAMKHCRESVRKDKEGRNKNLSQKA